MSEASRILNELNESMLEVEDHDIQESVLPTGVNGDHCTRAPLDTPASLMKLAQRKFGESVARDFESLVLFGTSPLPENQQKLREFLAGRKDYVSQVCLAILDPSTITESTNWVENSEADLQLEYKVEYQFHVKGQLGNIWPEFEDFHQAYVNGETRTLTKEDVSRISGATLLSDDGLFSLIKSYRSYPEFRNEKTFQAIIDGMEKGSPMKMPIILDINGRLQIMSGNTRLNLAMNHIGSAVVKIVKV